MLVFKTPHLYWNKFMIFLTFLQLSTCVHELKHSLLICLNHYSQITPCTYCNIFKHMQLNVLQLYLNGLVNLLVYIGTHITTNASHLYLIG
jgi:hypothetical protein